MINEIMYNPEGDDNDKEFIEIFFDEWVNLTGYVIADSSSNDTLVLLKWVNSSYALIVEEGFNYSNLSASIYSAGAAIGNGLGNDGDEIYFYDSNLTLVDNLTYDDLDADGNGKSLEFYEGVWQESSLLGGTPGTANGESVCVENWTAFFGDCLVNDTKLMNYVDENSCGTVDDLPGDNGTYVECDYCSPNPVNTSWSEWVNQTECLANDTQIMNRSRIEYDANYSSCYAITNLSSDLWNNGTNITYWGFKNVSCDCELNLVNSSWTEWSNQTECLVNDTQVQNRSKVQYDVNNCGESGNETYWEFRSVYCDCDSNGIIGEITLVNTSSNLNLSLMVNGTSNLSQDFSGVLEVEFYDGNETVLDFDYNFSLSPLNLAELMIEKQNNESSYGYAIVGGLDLSSQNRTKTVYVDRLISSTGVCIKDEEVSSIEEITDSCSNNRETWVKCDGTNSQYSCEFNSTLNKYKISGLNHSGVKEQPTYCGDGSCNGGESCSSCSGDCGECSSNNGGSSGSSSGGGSLPQETNETSAEDSPEEEATVSSNPRKTNRKVKKITKEIDWDPDKLSQREEIAASSNGEKGLAAITGAFIGLFDLNENPWTRLALMFFVVVMIVFIYELIHTGIIKKEKKAIKKIIGKSHIKYLGIIFILVIIVVLGMLSYDYYKNTKIDDFAKCLTDEDFLFYGASNNEGTLIQKEIFKDSFQYVDYINCVKEINKCKKEGISKVPSWIIDGEIEEGIKGLEELADLSGCSGD